MMSRWTPRPRTSPWLVLLVAVSACGKCKPEAHAQSTTSANAVAPTTLEQCYLQSALSRANADAMYVARELCDRIFGTRPRLLVFLSPDKRRCEERWFDAQGRHEQGGTVCVLEHTKGDTWTYACEDAKTRSGYILATLTDMGDRFEPTGPVVGHLHGALYKNLAACVRARHAALTGPKR